MELEQRVIGVVLRGSLDDGPAGLRSMRNFRGGLRGLRAVPDPQEEGSEEP